MREYEGDVTFVSIAGRDDVDAMAAFVDRHDLDGVMPHVADPEGEIWARFDVGGQPTFVFVSDDGDVERVFGAVAESELTAHLERLEQR